MASRSRGRSARRPRSCANSSTDAAGRLRRTGRQVRRRLHDEDGRPASARKALAELPGDWSWLGEPISDVDAYAELFEAVGDTGKLFMVQYGLESRWVLFAGGGKHEGYESLDECVLEGLAKLGW